VDATHPDLSIRRQCELLILARSTLYYVAADMSPEDIALMKAVDRIYTSWPFYGSRRIVLELRRGGHDANRKRVQRLMRTMGLQALVTGPHTSRPHPEHRIYPYLLRGADISRPDQVWAADITYIPLESGWAYLVAVIDWFSRAVLAWELSNTMTVDFCVHALTDALRQGREDKRAGAAAGQDAEAAARDAFGADGPGSAPDAVRGVVPAGRAGAASRSGGGGA
jgi:putative transposase